MSGNRCAREGCGKTVYPLEELKCLDKVWHKICFKCTTCGMALNMKTYKGYEKKPYCDAHYPKTVASVVADTPEMRRIAENTKLQSQVQYHAEYEKMKGTKIEIADDPELQRHLSNTKVQSQAQYHNEADRKAKQEANRPQMQMTSTLQQQQQQAEQVPTEQRQVGSIADYDPMNGQWGTAASGGGAEKPAAAQSTPAAAAAGAKTTSPSKAGGGDGGAKTKQASKQQTAAAEPQQPAGGAPVNRNTGFAVKALYDYTAADKDEVSFKENDIIVNCQQVDEGWMTGTVQRTLMWGMLPANYVEKINQPTGLFKLS